MERAIKQLTYKHSFHLMENAFTHIQLYTDENHLCWGRPQLLRSNHLFRCPFKLQTKHHHAVFTGIIWILWKRRFCTLSKRLEYRSCPDRSYTSALLMRDIHEWAMFIYFLRHMYWKASKRVLSAFSSHNKSSAYITLLVTYAFKIWILRLW